MTTKCCQTHRLLSSFVLATLLSVSVVLSSQQSVHTIGYDSCRTEVQSSKIGHGKLACVANHFSRGGVESGIRDVKQQQCTSKCRSLLSVSCCLSTGVLDMHQEGYYKQQVPAPQALQPMPLGPLVILEEPDCMRAESNGWNT